MKLDLAHGVNEQGTSAARTTRGNCLQLLFALHKKGMNLINSATWCHTAIHILLAVILFLVALASLGICDRLSTSVTRKYKIYFPSLLFFGVGRGVGRRQLNKKKKDQKNRYKIESFPLGYHHENPDKVTAMYRILYVQLLLSRTVT